VTPRFIAEQKLDGGPVDERAGKRLEFPDDVVYFAVPDWFLRARVIHHVSAHQRKIPQS
jgi:hypothetical protein